MIGSDVLVRPGRGASLEMRRGQRLRVVEEEGPQAADLVAFAQSDPRESMSIWFSRHLGGTFTRIEKLYTKLPAATLIFTLTHCPDRSLWLSPGRCNRFTYDDPHHPNCQDILAQLIAPYGLSAFDVPDVLNLFMDVEFERDGTYTFAASPVKPGDYIELRAELDCVVAVSACPSEKAFNEGQPKPLRLVVLES
jgi:uncharacterized protein YcgI (DUF1989 family)